MGVFDILAGLISRSHILLTLATLELLWFHCSFFSFFFSPLFFYSLFDITTCSSAFRMTRPMGLMTVRIYRRWEQKIITDYRSGSFLARQLEVEDISFLIVHLGPDSLYLCTRRDRFKSSLPSVPDKSISSQRPYSNPTACYM